MSHSFEVPLDVNESRWRKVLTKDLATRRGILQAQADRAVYVAGMGALELELAEERKETTEAQAVETGDAQPATTLEGDGAPEPKKARRRPRK